MIDRLYISEAENRPFKLPTPFTNDPLYIPVTEIWQKQKSQEMGIKFYENFEQQPALTGSLLSELIPWQTENIERDGNCFFRFISKMITGTEDHHVKLRAEICRYMVTTGRALIKRYLRTFTNDTTPVEYLKKSGMTENAILATDVELLAVSGMLNSDVYIATEQFDNITRRNTWNRYSCCTDSSRNPHSVSLYISNINHNHYEPVIRLINSGYESYKLKESTNGSVETY